MAKKKARRKRVELEKSARSETPKSLPEAPAKEEGSRAAGDGTPSEQGVAPARPGMSRLIFPLILMAISITILIRGAFVGKAEQSQSPDSGTSAGGMLSLPENVRLPNEGFQTLSPPIWLAALKKSETANTVILDVRTPGEASSGVIAPEGYRFLNLDFNDEAFEQHLNRLEKDKTYFVYCSTGYRSGLALDLMKGLGFKRAFNLSGGITEYRRSGLPVAELASSPGTETPERSTG
ncbi:MAG: rhodanese-like domain-containing protein [bacterium JZ-2024 1]